MFSLTIVFGPASTNWRLLYKSKENVEPALATLRTPISNQHEFTPTVMHTLCDDFGQIADIKHASIHGWMLENMDESKVGQMEFGLHNARTQASFQQRVEADPTMRAATVGRRPAVLNPMGNGMM